MGQHRHYHDTNLSDKIKQSIIVLFAPALQILWHTKIPSLKKTCSDHNLLFDFVSLQVSSHAQILLPSASESPLCISEGIRICYESTATKKTVALNVCGMCICMHVCKYVLMGPLIKTLGVSAICQHWSIGCKTDSSLCVRVCVHMPVKCVRWVFQAASKALSFVVMLYYMSLGHVTAVEVGLTHIILLTHMHMGKFTPLQKWCGWSFPACRSDTDIPMSNSSLRCLTDNTQTHMCTFADKQGHFLVFIHDWKWFCFRFF